MPAQRFAPQVRLLDDMARVMAQTTLSDVISVRITLVNSGCSQLTMTLNNQRQEQNNASPGFPPWKYNDLSRFYFGQRFAVQLRYAEPGADAGWRTLMFARITNLSFAFPSGGGSTLTIEAEDLLSLLKQFPDADLSLNHVDEVDGVRRLLGTAPLSEALPLAEETVLPRARFSRTLSTLVFAKGTTYLQSLQALADRLDYEIFVDNHVLKGHTLHFEPARSLWSLQGQGMRSAETATAVPLEWGRDLVEFTPRLTVGEQYTGLSVRGSNPRPGGPRIAENVGGDEILDELPADSAADPRLLTAVKVRQRFFDSPGERNNAPTRQCSGLDAERARLQIAAELRAKARELVTAEVTTIGRPELVPGTFVSIERMREPFHGRYYVTKAVHSVDGSGYRTQLTLRRPFLYLPEQEPRR